MLKDLVQKVSPNKSGIAEQTDCLSLRTQVVQEVTYFRVYELWHIREEKGIVLLPKVWPRKGDLLNA